MQASAEKIVELDPAWLARSWKDEPPRAANLVLLPGHPSDEETFAPCAAPPRIAVRYVDSVGRSGEFLLACIDYCDPALSGELWGRLTRLVDVDALTPGAATIVLRLTFAKLGFDPETGSSENAQGDTVFETGSRTRILTVHGPFGLSGEPVAGSCSEGFPDFPYGYAQ